MSIQHVVWRPIRKADMLEPVLNWIEEEKRLYSNNKPIAAQEIGYHWKYNNTYDKDEHAKDLLKKVIILLSHHKGKTTISHTPVYFVTPGLKCIRF
jgi:hypothetical protein